MEAKVSTAAIREWRQRVGPADMDKAAVVEAIAAFLGGGRPAGEPRLEQRDDGSSYGHWSIVNDEMPTVSLDLYLESLTSDGWEAEVSRVRKRYQARDNRATVKVPNDLVVALPRPRRTTAA